MGNRENLSVAVVAGGRSRRMGRDKALIEIHGRPLLQRVIAQVSTVGDEVFVVASERPEYAAFGVRVVPDRVPGAAALGGIYTAVAEASHPFCLVVACDMPYISSDLLRHMAGLPREYDALVPVTTGDPTQGTRDTFETLHAIYGKSCLPAMARRLERGDLKLAELLAELNVRRLPDSAIRTYDPELLSFFNANTPEDVAWARRHAAAFDAEQQRRERVPESGR